MADDVHKAYTDDGVTYCGWDGHDGCGHLWPCPTVRAYRDLPPVGNPDQSLIRSVLLYGTGFRWRRPDGEVLVLDPAEVDVFVPADMPETMAEAESRGRAAGYADAVRALAFLVEANYHPASSHGVLLRSVVARMEKLAAAARATTEETPR